MDHGKFLAKTEVGQNKASSSINNLNHVPKSVEKIANEISRKEIDASWKINNNKKISLL